MKTTENWITFEKDILNFWYHKEQKKPIRAIFKKIHSSPDRPKKSYNGVCKQGFGVCVDITEKPSMKYWKDI